MSDSAYLQDIAAEVGKTLGVTRLTAPLLTATQQLLAAGLRDPARIAARILDGLAT